MLKEEFILFIRETSACTPRRSASATSPVPARVTATGAGEQRATAAEFASTAGTTARCQENEGRRQCILSPSR